MSELQNEVSNFNVDYSAKQQQEIDSIRKKYLPKEEDKMELLRQMDKSTEKPGAAMAIVLGIVGSLLLGTGMSCIMVWADKLFVLGIIVGVVGIVVASMAYPVYRKMTKKQREKMAEQILALSEEISL